MLASSLLLLLAVGLHNASAFVVGPQPHQMGHGRRSAPLQASMKRVEVSLQKPMGLQLEELGESEPGVEVVGVVKGSNAEKSGVIEAGMKVLEIGGIDASSKGFDEIMDSFAALPEGAPVVLVLGKTEMPLEALLTIVDANEGSTIECKTGTILRNVLQGKGCKVYDLWGTATNCGGAGNCGTCAVMVKNGQGWGSRSDVEEKLLKGRPASHRLSCQTVVVSDATITLRPPKNAT